MKVLIWRSMLLLKLELNEADDNYITTEETVSYKLYYNPNEVIEITD